MCSPHQTRGNHHNRRDPTIQATWLLLSGKTTCSRDQSCRKDKELFWTAIEATVLSKLLQFNIHASTLICLLQAAAEYWDNGHTLKEAQSTGCVSWHGQNVDQYEKFKGATSQLIQLNSTRCRIFQGCCFLETGGHLFL